MRAGDYLGNLIDELWSLAILLFKNLCRVDKRTERFLFSAPRQENVRPNAM